MTDSRDPRRPADPPAKPAESSGGLEADDAGRPTAGLGSSHGTEIWSPAAAPSAGGSRGGAPGPAPVHLAAGEVLAGRFEIVRFIGHGGMGDVYEAEDLELGERVALKTVRPEIAHLKGALDRFRREIQLARKVTHPNVCRIFDLFRHRLEEAEGQGAEISFLSMELLAGETLEERLRRDGKLRLEEALPIVRQVGEGLTAAHDAGVIHRDLKPANVMLVPSSGGLRAVVTDFGLARAHAEGEGRGGNLTVLGEILGTPAYMAPEQVSGGEVTAATDIYALGAVIYEMVTGSPPFVGENPFSVAFKRLKEAPPPPSLRVPGLDPAWEGAILRCLERSPADRFSQARDVAAAMAGEEREKAPWPRRRRRRALAIAFLVGLAAAGVWLWTGRHGHERSQGGGPPASAPSSPRRAVAVLGFDNLSGSPATSYLEASLVQMLPSELAAGGHLRVVPSEETERARRDLGINTARSFAPDTLAKLRERLGADLVIAGSYLAVSEPAGGRKIRCDLQIQDAVSGETVATLQETGTEAGFLDLVPRLGEDLRARLRTGPLSVAESDAVKASLPANAEAARLYAQGVEQLNSLDAVAARGLFERALLHDPKNPLFHARLAAAWTALGYDKRAADEIKQAVALAKGLSFEERRQIEAQSRATLGDWAGAATIYGELASYFSDNLDYGLRLAHAQVQTGHAADALRTADQLRRLPPPVGRDPLIDLAEAEAAFALSSFERSRDAAVRAAGKGAAQRALVVVASSRFYESKALRSLDRLPEALAAAEESSRIASQAGDLASAARALNAVGTVLLSRGDVAGAERTLEKVLDLSRQIGNEKLRGLALVNLGVCRGRQGDLAGARRSYEEARPVFHQVADRGHEAAVLENLAMILSQEGRGAEARSRHGEALAIYHQLGQRSEEATVLLNLGLLGLEQADLAGAQALCSRALAIYREIGEAGGVADAQAAIGQVLVQRGDLAAGGRLLEAAVASADRAGEKGTAATLRLPLTELELEQGRPSPAEAYASAAIAQFHGAHMRDQEAEAEALLARALLAQRSLAQAQSAIDRADRLAAQSLEPAVKASVALAKARVVAAARPEEALRILDGALGQAQAAGLGQRALELRLAIGEIEMASPRGNRRRAAGGLAALEKEARSHGFRLIADRAARLLASGRSTPG